MKIAILGLTATSYGSHTYLENLLPQLARIDNINEYEVFIPAAHVEELSVHQENFHTHVPARAPKSGALRVAWEQLAFPRILRKHGVDVIYTTQNMATLFSSRPSVIIIQNVEPFFAGQFPNPIGKKIRLWLIRMMTEISLRRSKGILAISDWEKEFLIERFQLPEGKIVVSYPGVTEGFEPPKAGAAALLRERLGIEPPFLLCVTRLAGYGNLLNLARAFVSLVKAGKLDVPLVIPGEVWDEQYIGKVRKLLADEGCGNRVKFIGYVPHREMPLLFGQATCFIFPSLLEACGTVMIEALACGTPILCCRRRPMSDIGGDAAVLFEGENPDDIASKIVSVVSDPGRREDLSQRALKQAKRFSWQQGAEKVHEMLEKVGSRGAMHERSHTPPERTF